jgi:hypothetical protein
MSGHLNAFWRLTGRRVFAQLGMRAITAAIGVGRLSRDSGRYLVGPVQLREQFEMGNVASLGRKNLPVGSSISSWAVATGLMWVSGHIAGWIKQYKLGLRFRCSHQPRPDPNLGAGAF